MVRANTSVRAVPLALQELDVIQKVKFSGAMLLRNQQRCRTDSVGDGWALQLDHCFTYWLYQP